MINFLYGDDTVLLTNYIEELKELLSFFRVHSEGRGLFMGKKKTKLIILKNTTLLFCKIKLHKKIEKNGHFEYHGSIQTSNYRSEQNIDRRISIDK